MRYKHNKPTETFTFLSHQIKQSQGNFEQSKFLHMNTL